MKKFISLFVVLVLLTSNTAFAFENVYIMPSSTHYVTTWEALRDAVTDIANNTGTGEIILTNDILTGGNVITIPEDVSIILTGGSTSHTLIQTSINQRHFNLEPRSTLVLRNISLSGDEALFNNANVGGVHINGGSLFLSDGAVITRVSVNNAGGAVEVVNSGTLVMEDGSRISGNRGRGVDINTPTGVFNMNGGTIGGLEADAFNHDGGVRVRGGAEFNMNGGTIAGHRNAVGVGVTANGAGVLVVGSTFNMQNGTISDNTATASGGGVHVSQGGRFNMVAGIISDNNINNGLILNATNTGIGGGGVFVTGLSSIFTMYGGIITNNTANRGGGVNLEASAQFIMRAGTITQNIATGTNPDENGGGGVSLRGSGAADPPTTFIMDDAPDTPGVTGTRNITENIASNGGGVHVAIGRNAANGQVSNSVFEMGGNSNISNNTTPTTGLATGIGVRVSGGTFDMNGGTISGNRRPADQPSDGGGVFVTGANAVFDMNGGTISGNIVRNSGGGVFIANGGRFNMNAGNIVSNISNALAGQATTEGGGGVFITGAASRFYMGGTASNRNIANNAALNGGGVFLHGSAQFTMSGDGSTIQSNTTPTNQLTSQSHGIGVRIISGIFTMDGGTISDNSAALGAATSHGGGINVSHGGVLNLNNEGTIEANQATFGGGVFVSAGASSTGATDSVGAEFNMDGGLIYNNEADANGGGVFVSGGTRTGGNGTTHGGAFNFYNGSISGNEAESGGGVFVGGGNRTGVGTGVAQAGTLNMTIGAIINGNRAENGGGVFLQNSTGVALVTHASFTMAGGAIMDNTAAIAGGGLFIPDTVAARDSVIIQPAAVFSGNIAISGAFINNMLPGAINPGTTSIEWFDGEFANQHAFNNYDINATGTQFWRVEHSVGTPAGSITAEIVIASGNETLPTDIFIRNGSSVIFTATPAALHNFDNWIVNTRNDETSVGAEAHHNDKSITLAINAHTHVQGNFETLPSVPPLPPSPPSTGTEGTEPPQSLPPFVTDIATEINIDDDSITVTIAEHHAFIIGFDDGTIRPHATTTRAHVATIFFRIMQDESRAYYWQQSNPFSDVDANDWFNNAVSTTTNAGIFAGFPNGTFMPNREITRAELTAAAVRFMGENSSVAVPLFDDIAGHWAEEYINTAVQMGWVDGYPDGAFRPNQSVTRAETAALINRMLNRLPETSGDLSPDMIVWSDNVDTQAWYYLYIQEATNSYRYVKKADAVHERWIKLIPNRPWHLLEQPESQPEDIF